MFGYFLVFFSLIVKCTLTFTVLSSLCACFGVIPVDECFVLLYSRKLALASWSCSCFSKLSDGVDAPQKPQIID